MININEITIDNFKIIKLKDGWILKDYFSVAKQIEIYKYLVNLSAGSLEQLELPTSDPKFSYSPDIL